VFGLKTKKCFRSGSRRRRQPSPITAIHERNLKLKLPAANSDNHTMGNTVGCFAGHSFVAGEYTARFCPRSESSDPLHCQCEEPLQSTHHLSVIAAFSLHAEPRRQFLPPVSNTLLISATFGTKDGGSALGHSLATSARRSVITMGIGNETPAETRRCRRRQNGVEIPDVDGC